jgi:hypothetical protein
MTWRTVPEFCSKAEIKLEHVAKTYISLLKMMHVFIIKSNYEIDKQISVNHYILKEAVVAFYNDMARIKTFHVIDEPSFEKDDAYKAYWILRRKPLQILNEFENSEFLNEQFVTIFLLSGMAKKKNIDDKKRAINPTFKAFKSLLYRNLKYRTISQQSLELMIEAFFCGCDFTTP